MLHVPAGSLGGASDVLPLSPDHVRSGHFWGGGPESAGFCEGPGRAGDGPGAKLLSCRRADRTGGIDSFEGRTELLNIIRIVCEAETSAARGDLLHNPDGLCYGADSPALTVLRREPAGRYSLPSGGSRRGINQQESVAGPAGHSLLTAHILMHESALIICIQIT